MIQSKCGVENANSSYFRVASTYCITVSHAERELSRLSYLSMRNKFCPDKV